MDEPELRDVARIILIDLRSLVEDASTAEEIQAELEGALSLPEGDAKPALRAALSAHPELRDRVRQQFPTTGQRLRILPVQPGLPTDLPYVRYVCPIAADEDFFQGTGDELVPECTTHHVPLQREQA